MASRAALTSALDGDLSMKKPNSRSTICEVASTELAFSARSINAKTPFPGASSPIKHGIAGERDGALHGRAVIGGEFRLQIVDLHQRANDGVSWTFR